MFDYRDLAANYVGKNGYTRYWDAAAKVPYLWNPGTQTFITYDDPESIGEKARYVKSKGLAGAMLWEISGDTSDHELLDSLNLNMG